MRVLALLAVLALVLPPVFAGEASDEGSCLTGFACENMCPLARQANEWRATGTEALTVLSTVHADHVALVVKNLARI